MSDKIKIAIAGINGRMGKASTRMILDDPQLQLVGGFDRPGAALSGKDVGELIGAAHTGILVSNSNEELGIKPDVLLDFSIADAACANALRAIELGIRPVVGTSGLQEQAISKLADKAERARLGAMVVPNFSVGAVLMMEFAAQAGAYFENVEIVEMHHTKKVDAPSGTAMHTVSKLAGQGDRRFNPKEVEEHELLPHARGGRADSGVHVHSLRLPGLISHQEVIFGAPGELLTVRHDSFNTDCFMKGIKMAVQAVVDLDCLVVGLDKIMNGANQRQKIAGRKS